MPFGDFGATQLFLLDVMKWDYQKQTTTITPPNMILLTRAWGNPNVSSITLISIATYKEVDFNSSTNI